MAEITKYWLQRLHTWATDWAATPLPTTIEHPYDLPQQNEHPLPKPERHVPRLVRCGGEWIAQSNCRAKTDLNGAAMVYALARNKAEQKGTSVLHQLERVMFGAVSMRRDRDTWFLYKAMCARRGRELNADLVLWRKQHGYPI